MYKGSVNKEVVYLAGAVAYRLPGHLRHSKEDRCAQRFMAEWSGADNVTYVRHQRALQRAYAGHCSPRSVNV